MRVAILQSTQPSADCDALVPLEQVKRSRLQSTQPFADCDAVPTRIFPSAFVFQSTQPSSDCDCCGGSTVWRLTNFNPRSPPQTATANMHYINYNTQQVLMYNAQFLFHNPSHLLLDLNIIYFILVRISWVFYVCSEFAPLIPLSYFLWDIPYLKAAFSSISYCIILNKRLFRSSSLIRIYFPHIFNPSPFYIHYTIKNQKVTDTLNISVTSKINIVYLNILTQKCFLTAPRVVSRE